MGSAPSARRPAPRWVGRWQGAHLCPTPGRVPSTTEVQVLRCPSRDKSGHSTPSTHAHTGTEAWLRVATHVALDTSLAQDWDVRPCRGETLPAIAQREAQGGAEPFLLPVQLMETHREIRSLLKGPTEPVCGPGGQGHMQTEPQLQPWTPHRLCPAWQTCTCLHTPQPAGRGRAMLE